MYLQSACSMTVAQATKVNVVSLEEIYASLIYPKLVTISPLSTTLEVTVALIFSLWCLSRNPKPGILLLSWTHSVPFISPAHKPNNNSGPVTMARGAFVISP